MKINYRPEIDGLRAIAVSAVILYHSKIPLFGIVNFFSGGFIGVDIFFVISGYLITLIILKELSINGSFSFKHFYEKRIRRIFPVLLFVMLVSFIFAWMYLLPKNFVDYSKSIIYSIFFISNIFFYNSGQEYDAENGLFIPFLHTWSLSVEEQFYILFPIILFLIFKFFQKYLIYFLVASFLISFVLSNWYSLNNPSISFYFIHTRMWELLAGSILAYFEIKKSYLNKNKVLRLILPTAGILLIIFPILFLIIILFIHLCIHWYQ
jgi:peptidoglycan/LPS O-acetylase OafA/YrhL